MTELYRSSLEQLFEAAFSDAGLTADHSIFLAIREGTDNIAVPDELMKDEEEDESSDNLYLQIQNMAIPQKIKLAMLGNKTARALLIRDPNRSIAMFVLQNPRLTEGEVQEMAKNNNLDEAILREIANNSQWMRSYIVKAGLVANPKTPIDVSVKWVKHLHDADLRRLSRSKNIPQVLASQCTRMLTQKGK